LQAPPRIVAVVEDDPSMRRSVARLLTARGFATEAFASAEEFLQRHAGVDVGCLVLDIHLRGMTGIELRSRLEAAGRSVPIIFITAIDDSALERETRRAGCIEYLCKPFAAECLIGAVGKALAEPQPD
jgi:FixJ family two-component response regulator